MTIEQLIQNLLILVAAVVGGIGLYALMPRGTRRGRRLGTVLAVLALAILVVQLQPLGQWTASVTFYLLGVLALVGAGMTVTSRNPMYCALWFALVLLSTAGLFLLVGAQFVAAATVIVYAGAIVVTILFVVMLAQQQGLASYDRVSHEPFLATLTSVVLMAALTMTLLYVSEEETGPREDRDGRSVLPQTALIEEVQNRQSISQRIRTSAAADAGAEAAEGSPAGLPAPSHVTGLAAALLADNLISIEAAGTLLLVALVGAATIATRHATAGRQQAETKRSGEER